MGDSRTTGLATTSFMLRNAAGLFTGRTYGTYLSTLTPGGENGIRFNSSSFGGFSVTASAHGDDKWGVGANYAGSFNTVSIAAGVGYGKNSRVDGVADKNATYLGLSAGIKESSSGLFLQGTYAKREDIDHGGSRQLVRCWRLGQERLGRRRYHGVCWLRQVDRCCRARQRCAHAHRWSRSGDQLRQRSRLSDLREHGDRYVEQRSAAIAPFAAGPDVTQSISAITAGMTIGF